MSDKTPQDQLGSQRELSFWPTCPGCGARMSDMTRFCAACGTAIPGAAPSQASAASANAATDPAPDMHTMPNLAAGLPENVAGMLAYFIVPAITFLLIPPFRRNRFLAFHSTQCLLTVAVLILLQFALVLLGKALPLLVLSLYGLLILAEVTLWLLLLYKAYKHEVFKLPVIGDLAERLAA